MRTFTMPGIGAKALGGVITAGGLVLTLLLSGCASTSAIGNVAAVVPNAAVSDAKALIAQYGAKPVFTDPGPAIQATQLRGKKILVVELSQLPQQLVTLSHGIKSAADAVGINASFYDGQNSPSTIQAGIQQGIAQKVDAIILNGVVPSLVAQSLKAATAAGIPVVAATIGLNEKSPDVFGLASADYTLAGKIMASAAITEANGQAVKAGVIKFTNPAVPDTLSGIDSVFSTCHGACNVVATSNSEPGDWPTQVPSTATSLAKANSGLNTILAVVDDTMGQFAAAGLRQANVNNVKVIAYQGSGEAPLSVAVSSLLIRGSLLHGRGGEQ
jgi:ribose transport system substrate-binding protein